MFIVMTGIKEIDDITGGFWPGELVLICGRPGMGKTTLLNRIVLSAAHNAVRDKKPEYVIYFKQEKRVFRCGIPRFRGIRNIQDKAVIDLYQSMLSVEDIVEILRLEKKKRNISAIAIDCLQTLGIQESAGDNKVAIAGRLKRLAEEEKLVVFLVSGLWRNVDLRRDHTPLLSDLAMIGDIEPSVDMVIFLHRTYFSSGSGGAPLEILPGPTTVTIARNQRGAVGSCECGIREFGEPRMFGWNWEQGETKFLADTIGDRMRYNASRKNNISSMQFRPYEPSCYSIRSQLRWLFFGSPDPLEERKPEDSSNGYVINGLRMNDKGFARLNAGLRWPIAADDPILDHDISERLLNFDQSLVPEQYNAICPLDGYVTAINSESYFRLPPDGHVSNDGPDKVYRLCPHCLLELASRLNVLRTVRSVD